jgi:acetyltransferase-like isoleucine patch superfamily enzyme
MRFTIPALNNDYFDEDYLRVFGFPKMGKNVRVHRSVVFSVPAHVYIGDDVYIGPYCVFEEGRITIGDNVTIKAGCYFEGRIFIPIADTVAPNSVFIGDPVKKKKPVVEEDTEDEDE